MCWYDWSKNDSFAGDCPRWANSLQRRNSHRFASGTWGTVSRPESTYPYPGSYAFPAAALPVSHSGKSASRTRASSTLWSRWAPILPRRRELASVGRGHIEERAGAFRQVGLINHAWSDPGALTRPWYHFPVGNNGSRGRTLAPVVGRGCPVPANKAALEYDHILILGPTFPHEVAGFSGGAKYLFPGISGPEMINATTGSAR